MKLNIKKIILIKTIPIKYNNNYYYTHQKTHINTTNIPKNLVDFNTFKIKNYLEKFPETFIDKLYKVYGMEKKEDDNINKKIEKMESNFEKITSEDKKKEVCIKIYKESLQHLEKLLNKINHNEKKEKKEINICLEEFENLTKILDYVIESMPINVHNEESKKVISKIYSSYASALHKHDSNKNDIIKDNVVKALRFDHDNEIAKTLSFDVNMVKFAG
jgi:hypothetical protein